MVKLGVLLPFVDALITSGPFLRDFAGTVEESGAESVWSVEHVVIADDYEPRYPYSADGKMLSPPGTYPIPDPLELLAFVAAASERLQLGTAVVVAPLHSPAVLAKRAATIDRLSGGRMVLGLGIGWQREEYEAVGVPFRDRGRRLEECIAAMRVLWAGGPASFEGTYVAFDRVHPMLTPLRGSIPIVLGGSSEPAAERAGRLADGWFPFTIGPDEFAERADVVRAAALAAGRDERDVEITVWPGSFDPRSEEDVKWVRTYVDAGATRLVVRARISGTDGLSAVREQLTRYRDEVLAGL